MGGYRHNRAFGNPLGVCRLLPWPHEQVSRGVLPEDRLDANIDDGDSEQGFFSPWSWWPILLAAGGALLFMGIAIGIWIAFFGAALTIISLVGWVYEYYRGNFAR